VLQFTQIFEKITKIYAQITQNCAKSTIVAQITEELRKLGKEL